MYTNAEILANRKVWTDALRSGKYIQGRSRLRYGDAFDCLGVLCDTGVVPGQWEKVYDDIYMWTCDSGASYTGALSRLHLAAVGLSYEAQDRLMIMNDGLFNYHGGISRPSTFAQIADYIDTLPIHRDTPLTPAS